MKYFFEIVGVSPIISFFTYQQETQPQSTPTGPEYLGAYRCTLDAFIQTVEPLPRRRGWDLDPIIDTVINFWLKNAELVNHWKNRLEDAGKENLIVARVSDVKGLQSEFESLFGS